MVKEAVRQAYDTRRYAFQVILLIKRNGRGGGVEITFLERITGPCLGQCVRT